MRRRFVVAVSVLAVGAAACSSGGPSSSASDTTQDEQTTITGSASGLGSLPDDAGYDVCDLVPVDLVNRDLGLSLTAGQPRDDDPNDRVCQYGDYSFNGTGDILVSVYVADGDAQAHSIFDDVVFVVSGAPVDGVGDEAAAAPFSSRFVMREGNVVVDVYGESGQARLGADDPELQALALDILDLAASLPGASTGDQQTAP